MITIPIPVLFQKRDRTEENKIEGLKLMAERKKQALGMCECGHSWIEHNNHATLTSNNGFQTETKECHFCGCEQFANCVTSASGGNDGSN